MNTGPEHLFRILPIQDMAVRHQTNYMMFKLLSTISAD